MTMLSKRLLYLGIVCLVLATGSSREVPEANAAPADKTPDSQPANANGRVVKLDAKPEAFIFDTAKAAVIVVDMQNDFGAKGGMFDLAGIDISDIKKAAGPTAKVLALARQAGIKVIYLKMGFRPDLSDMGTLDSVNRLRHLQFRVGEKVRAPDGKESRVLIRDTWNTDILAELKPKAGDDIVYKTRFSGFYETDLDDRLKKAGAKYLIVTGCTTSVCVDSTVRDAMFRDYLCVVLSDCVAEPIGQKLPRSNHDASLLTFEVVLGWLSDSEKLSKVLQP
jgi:ureidoacrylate peracid hydrolase